MKYGKRYVKSEKFQRISTPSIGLVEAKLHVFMDLSRPTKMTQIGRSDPLLVVEIHPLAN